MSGRTAGLLLCWVHPESSVKGEHIMTALITLLPNLNQLLPQLISQFGSLIYLGLFAMIFIETGVVVLPFLPGDSLLFLCGSLAAMANHSLNIWVLFGLLSVAAVLGDSLNFEIGEHFGLRLAHSAKLSRFIKPAYLERSQRFFDKAWESRDFPWPLHADHPHLHPLHRWREPDALPRLCRLQRTWRDHLDGGSPRRRLPVRQHCCR